ncbi:homoserine kinase-like [Trifolium pratense]|uniref:homoserine kinase-like n=1 Tax=Trifolium pratense TaxID=57577 RepID=UPI001E6931A4|nr:homoserine kinase-like [Trifolium pratense]
MAAATAWCPASLNSTQNRAAATFTIRCNAHKPITITFTKTQQDPQPIYSSVKAFAPATVANLGPGFDFLGCAVDGIGDTVSLKVDPDVHPGQISISDISGQSPNIHKLSKNPLWNCAGIAAIEAMKMLGIRSVGLSLSLEKGLPLGSGLGSSAASAAAAAVAVNEIFGKRLGYDELVLACLKSEEKVSGYHADNVAPSIMGGFVLIRNYEPLELVRLKFPSEKELYFVLVTPEFEAPTKKMRAALPLEIGMPHHVWNCSQAGALVAGVLQGDLLMLGKALSSDKIVEPKRAPLIPGMDAVKKAAIEAGAFGCTISGAGPTAVAITDDEQKGHLIGQQMVQAFQKEGNLNASANVKQLDRIGARLISGVRSS